MARTFLVTTNGVDWPGDKLASWLQVQLQAASNGARPPLGLAVEGVAEVVESKPEETKAPAKGKK